MPSKAIFQSGWRNKGTLRHTIKDSALVSQTLSNVELEASSGPVEIGSWVFRVLKHTSTAWKVQSYRLLLWLQTESPEVLEFLVEKLVPPGLCLSEAWMNELRHINGHFHWASTASDLTRTPWVWFVHPADTSLRLPEPLPNAEDNSKSCVWFIWALASCSITPPSPLFFKAVLWSMKPHASPQGTDLPCAFYCPLWVKQARDIMGVYPSFKGHFRSL